MQLGIACVLFLSILLPTFGKPSNVIASGSFECLSGRDHCRQPQQRRHSVDHGQAQPAALSWVSASLSDSHALTSSEVDLKVQTVGLGSPLKKVRKRLGPPTKQHREFISDNTCYSSATSFELSYSGMTIRLLGSLKGKEFTVVSMEVEAPAWLIQPGLRVGMEERLVRKKLGAPIEESDENGFHRLHYVNKGNDGFAIFCFKDGTLAKLRWESALC